MRAQRLLDCIAVGAVVVSAVATPIAASPVRPPAPSVPATYALGDSVLIDAEGVLVHLVSKLRVDAAVSRQFSTGLQVVTHLRETHRLTTRFVVFLGTNGPIEPSQFAQMLRELDVCKRIVLVTLWVPTRGWMRANNDLIRTGPKRSRHVVIADWTALARAHPGWFYADQVHLPIDGPGATALARLIARALSAPVPRSARGVAH
jgi:hypothetical protein